MAGGTVLDPACYPAPAAATVIYFLLPAGAESVAAVLRRGVAVALRWPAGAAPGAGRLRPAADPVAVTLGPDLTAGQRPQYVVRAGGWQSARPAGTAEVLVSCVVAPGFDVADFTTLPG